MNRKISLGTAITVLILAVALTISATMMLAMRHFSSLVSAVGQRQAMYDYLDEIDVAARDRYTIDEEALRAALAKGYLQGLSDPYAAYLSSAEYQQVQNELRGDRTGFGLQLVVLENAEKVQELVVSHVDPNSPAALAGIKAGAIITEVDGAAVNGASYTAVMGRLDNEKKLRITVRQSDGTTTTELSSNTYSDVSVEGKILQETVGYIRIRSFNNLTALQFKNEYNKLTQQGALYFVLDLRNNAGGSMDAVKEILDYLLPRGPYANCTKKDGVDMFTAADTYEITAPTVTLVNGVTMGEAELLAGALQEAGKTRLVGTSTAGKAVVQEYFPLSADKSAVKLTTGALTLLSGANWQDTGLMPSQTVDLSLDKLMKFELLSAEEDDQLKAALTLLTSGQYTNTATGTTTAAPTTTTTAATKN